MLSNKADNVLREIEGRARWRPLPIVGRRKGEVLIQIIRDMKPKHVLEI